MFDSKQDFQNEILSEQFVIFTRVSINRVYEMS